jgi:hypothetical protein
LHIAHVSLSENPGNVPEDRQNMLPSRQYVFSGPDIFPALFVPLSAFQRYLH